MDARKISFAEDNEDYEMLIKRGRLFSTNDPILLKETD